MKGNKYGNLVEGRKVFDCGKNRGSIVEAVELIREEDFDNDQFGKKLSFKYSTEEIIQSVKYEISVETNFF